MTDVSVWDKAPWMIGGGVEHPVELARLLSFAAFGGNEGVISPSDLKVVPLAPPGAGVRVSPGACAIINRGAGADSEAYAGRLRVMDTVAIPSTGAGAGRTDMIVARVEDPFQPGETWDTPTVEDRNDTNYIFSRRIPSVLGTPRTLAQAGFATYSAIPLALVVLPVSTSVVQASHITDLRRLWLTRSLSEDRHVSVPSGQVLSSASYVTYPASASFSVDVPGWATYVNISVVTGGGLGADGNVGPITGNWRFALGTGGGQVTSTPQPYVLDAIAEETPANQAGAFAISGSIEVPEVMRETSQTLALQVQKTSGGGTSSIRTTPRTDQFSFHITWGSSPA